MPYPYFAKQKNKGFVKQAGKKRVIYLVAAMTANLERHGICLMHPTI